MLDPRGLQDFLHTFNMALYPIWDVKNGFTYGLTFFSLISDGLGGVNRLVKSQLIPVSTLGCYAKYTIKVKAR